MIMREAQDPFTNFVNGLFQAVSMAPPRLSRPPTTRRGPALACHSDTFELHRRLCGLDRGRHESHSLGTRLQAGQPRNRSPHSSQCRNPGEDRSQGGADRVCRCRLGIFRGIHHRFRRNHGGALATGLDQVSAFSAVAAALNNLGPGLGEVASGFMTVSNTGKWIAMFAMVLGRLEIFTLLVLITPTFWRR